MKLLLTFLQLCYKKAIPSLLVACFFVSAFSQAASFQRSVNRLHIPANLTDVVHFSEAELQQLPPEVQALLWPEQLHGWVERAHIETWLSESLNQPIHLQWQGVRKAWVQRCFPLEFNHFSDELNNKIHQTLPEYLQVESVALNSGSIPCIDSPFSSVQVNQIAGYRPNQIKATLMLNTAKGAQEIEANLEAVINAKGLRTLQNAEKGTHAIELDLEMVLIPWKGEAMLTKQALDNKQLAKTLNKGALLTQSNVSLIPLVAQGEKVKVQLAHGSIHISTHARALTAGDLGDEINIQVKDSPRVSKAIVIAKGVVNVSV